MQQQRHGLAHELWLATRELMGPARPSLEHESEVAAQWGMEPPTELRAIRTESGDTSCARTSGPPRARCLSHELRLDFAECTTTDEVWTGHIPTPHLLVFAWRTVGTRPVRCALSPSRVLVSLAIGIAGLSEKSWI